MKKGIIYVMSTTITGVIKIGKTGKESYKERMRFLESNGYRNVPGLKRLFAIELDDYENKEKLLQEVFSKHRIGETELFALEEGMIQQLLSSFEGNIIYPEGNIENEEVFEKITEERRQGPLFSFYRKGIKINETITFVDDNTITAKVIGEREVEFENDTWKLSPLTKKIFEERDQLNNSGAYQGAAYWIYNGKRLKDLPDVE